MLSAAKIRLHFSIGFALADTISIALPELMNVLKQWSS